jgi:hypothetical protein
VRRHRQEVTDKLTQADREIDRKSQQGSWTLLPVRSSTLGLDTRRDRHTLREGERERGNGRK